VKDGNDKMVTKEIPETWLKQIVVPKYWKHAEQFFNHRNGWVAFSKNDNTVKHFRDVRGIMKNVEEFKEVYRYSDGVSGPKILVMKFLTKIDENLTPISTDLYVRTSESGERYEKLDEEERKHILYDDEWNAEKK
jgi:hypothetical protein